MGSCLSVHRLWGVSARTLSQNEQRVVITGFLRADGSITRLETSGLPVAIVK